MTGPRLDRPQGQKIKGQGRRVIYCAVGVMPTMSHCQITRSTRVARQIGIIKPNPNPTTNPNPNRRNSLNQ